MVQWVAYLQRVGDAIMKERLELRRERIKRFGTKLSYEHRPDLLSIRKPGRKRLVLFEECRVRILKRIYDVMGIILSHDQERLLDEMRNAMLPKFYGSIEEVHNDIAYLYERYGIKDVKDALQVIYPRRHGKTLTQTICSAIVLLTQRAGNVCAYNLVQDHARTWMDSCRRFLDLMRSDDVFGWTLKHEIKGRQLLLTQNCNNGEPALLIVFGNAGDGSKARNLRSTGGGAFMINMDEYGFFHDEAFKVIFPTAANAAAIIMTSSRPSHKTTVMTLVNQVARHTKRRILRTLDWRRTCDECRVREQTTGMMVECEHIVKAPMHFRSFLNMLRVEALLEPFDGAGRTEMYNESVGVLPTPVYMPGLVNSCFGVDAPRPSHLPHMTHFFVGIDPGSTHGTSETAIVSGCFTRNIGADDDDEYTSFPDRTRLFNSHFVILGVDSCAPKDKEEMASIVLAHIARVRQLPGFDRTSKAIVACEDNSSYIAVNLMWHLEDQGGPQTDWMMLHLSRSGLTGRKRDRAGNPVAGGGGEPGDLLPGIWTTLENKAMVIDGWIKRMMTSKRLHMHRDLVTYTTPNAERERQVAEENDLDLRHMRQALGLDATTVAATAVATPSAVHKAIAEARKVDMEMLICKQFNWMRREVVPIKKRGATDGDTVKSLVKFKGKGGVDPDTGLPKRDDVVMGVVLLLLGAFGFYTSAQYGDQRRALRLVDP